MTSMRHGAVFPEGKKTAESVPKQKTKKVSFRTSSSTFSSSLCANKVFLWMQSLYPNLWSSPRKTAKGFEISRIRRNFEGCEGTTKIFLFLSISDSLNQCDMSPPHSFLEGKTLLGKAFPSLSFFWLFGGREEKFLSSFQSAQLLFVFPLCLSFLFPGDVFRFLWEKKKKSVGSRRIELDLLISRA